MTVLGFNDTSTLVGHFVSSPRVREKRDRRDSRKDEREGQGRKRKRNESEETEEIKTSPRPLSLPATRIAGLAQLKPISVGRPSDIRYTTPSRHPTTPNFKKNGDGETNLSSFFRLLSAVGETVLLGCRLSRRAGL